VSVMVLAFMLIVLIAGTVYLLMFYALWFGGSMETFNIEVHRLLMLQESSVVLSSQQFTSMETFNIEVHHFLMLQEPAVVLS
jgi:hypothetical protein